MNVLNTFLFVGLPYTALVVFLIGTIYRYKATGFKYSSLSSQFLEGRRLFWGSVPFHWGIISLFLGHLIAFLIPDTLLAWNRHPVRLLVIEVSALIFGIMVLYGLIMLFVRRVSHPRLKNVTSGMDIAVELLLLTEVVLGLLTALNFRWGSSWFAAVLTPYLRSLFVLQPNTDAVAALPLIVKLHVAFAFLIFGMIPFTRLVHVLVLPLHYLRRPYQLVVWNWDKRKVRNPATEWSPKSPGNN